MNKQPFNRLENEQSSGERENAGTAQDEVKISLPQIDRPEGPFEHSGETSGWTKEEAAEKKGQDQQ